MKKVLKWLLIVTAGFAVVLSGLVIILTQVFDPNEHKERLENAVSDATGRSFEIQGEIQWSIFPNIGFSAGPLLLGNATGFESAHFARIGRVEVSVQFMPLIDGEFEVGAVSINDLELDLEVNAAGEDNWHDLVQGGFGTSPASGDADSGGSAGLRIEGITLNGGLIRYTNQQAGMTVQAADISLHTSALELGQPLEAVLGMSLGSELWAGPMVINLELAMDDPLAPEPGRLRVQTLTVAGTVGENLPVVFELARPFEFDPNRGALQIEQWKLSAGPAEIHGSLDFSDGDTGFAVLSGRFDVAPFDARVLLAGLNGSAPLLANPESLSRVGGGANWQLAGDTAQLSDLDIQLDDSRISGQLKLSSIASLTGTARLDIDQIDLDQYLAADAGAGLGSDQSAAGNLSLPSSHLVAELKIGRVKVAGLVADNVSFSFKSAGTGFKLFPVKADLYQGQMNGGIELRGGAAGGLVIRNTLNGISAAPLLADLVGQSLISGTGNLAIELSFAQPFAANPWTSANGKLEFRLFDGAIHGVDVMGIMRQAAQLLGRSSEEFRNQDPATDFSSLRISAVIKNGVMTTQKMVLQSPYLRVTGDGSINLADNSIDYVIKPVLVSTPTGQGGLGLAKLEGITIPVTLSGTLDQPEWRIDPARLLLATKRGRLGEPVANLLEAISGSGNDGSGEQSDPGQNLLNALLHEAAKRNQKKRSSKPDSR